METKQEKAQKVKEWLLNTKLDAEVTGRTLNTPVGSITPQALLLASKKLIEINKGEKEPDDRDSLLFSKVLGLEDFVEEAIQRDAGKLQKKALRKIKEKKNLSWLQAGFFSPQVKSTIIGNPLAQNIEGINPVENIDLAHRITKLGPGGLPSTDSIPDESRQVNPSTFGFFDPFKLSENLAIGVDLRVAHNVRKGRDGKLYRKVLDSKGREVYVDHETFISSKVEVPEY